LIMGTGGCVSRSESPYNLCDQTVRSTLGLSSGTVGFVPGRVAVIVS